MINVKFTIIESIKDRIKKLRFLAQNNYNIFKKILYLIILDDLYDWSSYLDDSLLIQEKLKSLRIDYILCLKDFKVKYSTSEDFYTNVNIENYIGNKLVGFDEFIPTPELIEELPDDPSEPIQPNEPDPIDPHEEDIHSEDEHLCLSELTEIDSNGYMLIDNITITKNGYLEICENTIDNEGYIIK